MAGGRNGNERGSFPMYKKNKKWSTGRDRYKSQRRQGHKLLVLWSPKTMIKPLLLHQEAAKESTCGLSVFASNTTQKGNAHIHLL